jgi:hypothetical protein
MNSTRLGWIESMKCRKVSPAVEPGESNWAVPAFRYLRALVEQSVRKGFAHRFRPTYAGANMGHPYGVVGTVKGVGGRPAVSHISRKTSEMPRISCTQLWTGPRVRLSLKRAAGSSGNPRNSTGNRGCGAPGDCGGDRAQKPVSLYTSGMTTGHCFSPRSFNIGFTLGSVPSHALYIAARSSVFPRDRTMRRSRSPLARVNPPWSRNH